jgi:HlyD family secretion protein
LLLKRLTQPGVWLATLVVLLGVGTFGWTKGFWVPRSTPLELSGLVQADELRPASRLGGRVQRVLVQEGDWVNAHQPLVVFEEQELRNRIQQAEAKLVQAKAQRSLLAQGGDPEELRLLQQQIQATEASMQGWKRDELQSQRQLQQSIQGLSSELSHLKQGTQKALSLQHNQPLVNGVSPEAVTPTSGIAMGGPDPLEASLQEQRHAMADLENQIRQLQAQLNRPASPAVMKANQSELLVLKGKYQKLRKGARPAELTIQDAQVKLAETLLQGLRDSESETTVKASQGGVVSVLTVHPGDLVAPGSPVAILIDERHLWSELFVPESLLPRFHRGMALLFRTAAYPESVFAGDVVFISPRSEFARQGQISGKVDKSESVFRVKVRLSQWDQAHQVSLLPGMSVKVNFPTLTQSVGKRITKSAQTPPTQSLSTLPPAAPSSSAVAH